MTQQQAYDKVDNALTSLYWLLVILTILAMKHYRQEMHWLIAFVIVPIAYAVLNGGLVVVRFFWDKSMDRGAVEGITPLDVFFAGAIITIMGPVVIWAIKIIYPSITWIWLHTGHWLLMWIVNL